MGLFDAIKAVGTGGLSILGGGGAGDSLGGFLGLSDGPQAPGGKFGNRGIEDLNTYLNSPEFAAVNGPEQGSNFASRQVEANPTLMRGLNDMQTQIGTGREMLAGGRGLQAGQQDILNGLQNQGFELKPEDRSAYGQASGDIARLFGSQGNKMAQNLASRGLSSSGAAGAGFSGLAGNQNEMLAQAQQQIMQQRTEDTMKRIGQTQQFIGQLNGQNTAANQGLGQMAGQYAGQAASNVNQQYGRMIAGSQNQIHGASTLGGLEQNANNAENNYNMDAFNANVKNKPKNFMDFATAGAGQGIQSGVGHNVQGLFGG